MFSARNPSRELYPVEHCTRLYSSQKLAKMGALTTGYDGRAFSSATLQDGIRIDYCTDARPTPVTLVIKAFSIRNEDGIRNNFSGRYVTALVSTPCRYGWERWWFQNPHTWERSLYIYVTPDGRVGTRKELRLPYLEQIQGKSFFRYAHVLLGIYRRKAERIRSTIKYPTRNGKLTRKARAVVRNLAKAPSREEVANVISWMDGRGKVRKCGTD